MNLYTGGTLSVEAGDSTVTATSGSTFLMSLGTGILARPDGSTVTVRSAEEMRLNGAIVAAAGLELDSGPVTADYSSYFDTLPGKTLKSRVNPTENISITDATQIEAVLIAIAMGEQPTDLMRVMSEARYGLSENATVTVAGDFAGWPDLDEVGQQEVLDLINYTRFENGGFYLGDQNRFVETLTDGSLVTYDPSSVTWSAGAPAAGTAFSAMTAAQQSDVAASLGYTRVEAR